MACRTGGYLNVLNERFKCNDPKQTILISAIMRYHTPRTEEAMLNIINTHEHTYCNICKQKSRNGGLLGWITTLWNIVQQHGAGHNISRADCESFVYDLYIRAPVSGFYFEDMAVRWLANHGYNVRLATPDEDCKFSVDVAVLSKWSGGVLAGVQVKPESYRYVREDVHRINFAKNQKAGYPVFYLYYTKANTWLNDREVLTSLWCLVQYIRVY